MRNTGTFPFPETTVFGRRFLSNTLVRPTSLAVFTCGAAAVFAAATVVSLLHLHVDRGVLLFLNSFSQRSYLLDHLANDLDRAIFSSAIMVALFWYAWFARDSQTDRAALVVGLVAVAAGTLLSRSLQILLPTHQRPLQDPSLHFLPPSSVSSDSFHDWSSYPSDHAAIYFGLAAVLLLVNKRVGLVALFLAVGANLARVYLGLHSLVDIVGGGALGVLLVVLSARLRFHSGLRRTLARASQRPAFYAVAFYVCFCLSTLFTEYREVGAGILHALHHARHK